MQCLSTCTEDVKLPCLKGEIKRMGKKCTEVEINMDHYNKGISVYKKNNKQLKN